MHLASDNTTATEYHLIATEYVGTTLRLPMLGSYGDNEGEHCVVRIYLPFDTSINLNQLHELRQRIESKHDSDCSLAVRACEDALVLDMIVLPKLAK